MELVFTHFPERNIVTSAQETAENTHTQAYGLLTYEYDIHCHRMDIWILRELGFLVSSDTRLAGSFSVIKSKTKCKLPSKHNNSV
jgi:hypothetical protein